MEEYINDAGDLYTVDEINQAAKENKTTFEDIIKKNKLSLKNKKETAIEDVTTETPGKPKTVVKKDAVATAKSTASKSVTPSSVSSNNPFGTNRKFLWETDQENTTNGKLDFKKALQSAEYKKQQAIIQEQQKKQAEYDKASMEARYAKAALRKKNAEFLTQTTPPQEYIKTVDAETKAQIEANGKEETYMDYGRSEFSMPTVKTQKINSFPAEKKEVITDLQKSGTLSKYTQKDILDLAAEKYKKKKIASYVTNKAIDYYSNIDEDTKALKEDYLKKEGKFQNLELQRKASINGDIYNHLNQSSEELNSLTKQLKAYGKTPTFKTQEELDNYKDLAGKYDSLYKSTKDLLTTFNINNNDIANTKEKLKSVEEEYDLAKRNYGVLTNAGTRVFQGFSKLGAEMIQIANFMSPPGVREDVSRYIALSDRNNDEAINNFLGPQEEITDAKSFAKAGFNLVASQLPNWALMYATGGMSTAAEKATAVEATEAIAKTTVDQVAIDAGLGAFKIAAEDNQYLKLLKLAKDKLSLPSELQAIAVTSGVGKYNEEVASNALGETNFTPLQMFSSAMLYGYSEALGEKVTLDILKGGGRTLETAVKGDPEFVDLLKEKSMKSWFGAGFNFVGHKATDFANENLSEQFSNISQNAVDKFVLGKNVNLLDNTGQVFKDTSILTAFMISAPHVAGLAIKPFLGSNSTNEIKQNSAQIAKYIELMKNPELSSTEKSVFKGKIKDLAANNEVLFKNTIKDIDGMPDSTFKTILASSNELGSILHKAREIYNSDSIDKMESIKILESEYKQKEYDLNKLIGRTKMISQLSDNFSKEDKGKLFDLNNQAEDLKNEIRTLKENSNSDAIIVEKDQQLKSINAQINDVYSNLQKNIVTDIERTKTAAKELGLEEGIEMPKLNTANDVISYLSQNTNLDEDTINDVANKYGAFIPLSNGKEALIINKEEAEMDQVVTTGQHEFLHKLIYKAVKDDVELQKKIGTALYNHIENYIGTEVLNNTEFKQRYDTYKLDFEDTKTELEGKVAKAKEYLDKGFISQDKYDETFSKANSLISKAEGKYLEETLPLLSEALTKGDIKYNETFFTKLGDILRRIFQKYGLTKIKFDTGKDVFNFVRDYNKSFEKGQFTKAFKTLAKEGKYKGAIEKTAVAGETKAEVKKSQPISQVETLKKQLKEIQDNEFDYDPDDFDQQVANLQSKIKKAIEKEKTTPVIESKKEKEISEEEAVKEIIKSEKGSVSSDKVQQIYNEKGLNGANEIIKLFKPITNRIVDKRRDAPGFDRELLTDEIETGTGGILDLINKYNPEQGIPLAAYINKYLPVRAIATSRRLLDKQFNKDVTEEKGLMAEETAVEAKEKPKYKNALESKVFEPETLKTINDKILTVVRTLKSKINEPVSLNRTVTPIIAEIRDEIGKLVDIDIKTAMGGKKDNQLKNWLLKNKKYILENMTTTWLMGKDGQGGMPIAIQKQIDGKWTNYPEWVGKKIDREKTSTDNAGRTSGAELVRRLPNVANNISDADYLAQVLGPDGNPLRGRKESLAKAIAEEASFDIINDDLSKEGVIYDALEANQKRLGVEQLNNIAVEINKQIERGNVKFSRKLIKGFEISKDKLIKDIIEAPTAEDEINVINNWIASDGRSLRTIASKIGPGELYKLRTNRGLFENILLPIIKTASKFEGKIGEDSYKLEPVKGGESIYFGEDKVPLWADINRIKGNWESSVSIIDDEALKATNNLIDIVKYFKDNNYTKNDFESYVELLKFDQRGLFRKVSKAGLGVLGLTKKQEPRLEHNAPAQTIVDYTIDLFNNKITEQEFRTFIDESKVNLVPKALEDILPSYAEGKNRMYDPKAILFLKDLIDKGYKVVGLEKEYGSKANFEALIKLAKSGVNSKESLQTIYNNDAVTKSLISFSKPAKGISVFDFDDTIGLTKSNVLYTMPDGAKGKLNAEEFAKEGSKLLNEGAIFDFSEFSKVTNGKPGPMVEKMKKMISKFGSENFFILTARPTNSAKPIHEFLSSIGIDIPLENITGLGNSTAQAKADWMTAKAADGYNDFYFADDAVQNIEAVKKALNIPGVNSKVQQAIIKFSLKTKVDLDWKTKLGVTSANFKVGEYNYNIKMASIKDYGLSSEPELAETFEQIASNLGLPLEQLTDNQNFNWVSFAEEDKGSGILNTGNAFKVFGIVTNGFVDYIEKNNIDGIAFSAESAEPSRVRLYKTLASTIGARLGWNYTAVDTGSKENGTVFVINSSNSNSFKNQSKEVKNVLNVVDIKSKIQKERIKFSKTISPEFNKIIEENTGMADYKVFSDIVARRRGTGKNKFDIYVPPSAADFELLLYNFIGKGKRGEEQQKFFADALLKPYANGNDLMDAARQSIKNDYKALTDQFPDIRKKIEKLTPDGDFTYDQAIRVAMWTEEGAEIPGISQRDQKKLTELVNNDPELAAFKQGLIVTGRQGKGWVTPTEYWDASTIISDLHNLTEGEGRKKFLAEFIDNAQEMFGKWENGKLVGPNINKVEAVYGTNVRDAIENVLYRMTTGKNRSFGNDKETTAWSNWVNGSTGTIMFLNTRSAALQLIGAVNFLNLRDNNPIAAAKAFANQKQYWEDFAYIWNSDKMKERRGGLKEDVAAAEIANAAAGSKNKVNAVVSYLLKIGYTPTQLADSFAIASGGAPFYRNRIKSYLKEGLTQEEAETAAWNDFTKVSDETQQSGDPRDISKQQASGAGRLLLTFQNTAMQQSRIVKKAFLDLKNGRGDAKTHIAKITYYLAVQNIMFAALQQGLFAVLFSGSDKDDEEAKKKKAKDLNKKWYDIADGVLDTILRGTGFAGGIVATLKNMYMKYKEENPKDFKADYAKVVLEGANISPPIGSKLKKLYTGFQQTKFERDLIKERGWGVMQDGRVHLGPMYGVSGKIVEATANLPMDRLVNKIENVSQAMNSQNSAWQRVMIGMGWSPYSAGVEDTAGDKIIREKAKEIRAEEGKIKAKETRERTKDSIRNLPIEERIKLKREAALKRREEKLKKRKRKMG